MISISGGSCQSDLLVVPDLHEDDRFRELSYVAGEPYCRFYAGMPLINPEGYALGTLCVVDFKPRQITFAQAEAMRRLSRQVVAQLELRRNLLELKAAREALAAEMRKAKDLLLNILPAEIEPRRLRFAAAAHPRRLSIDCVSRSP